MSQTPWILDGKKLFESSVEELLLQEIRNNMKFDGIKLQNCIILHTFIHTCMFVADSKFSSSGREDVDVRMLGRGRPFMFELINPRKVHLSSQELSRIQDAINSTSKDIFVRDLQIVSKYILQLF